MKQGTLYIVSTPIGNLEDITYRAVKTLQKVGLIAAEDTRRARILLNAYGVTTTLTSYHSYNIPQKTPKLVEKLLTGQDIALVSDSGTPGISDPGSVLISESIKNNITVTAIPGPAAFVTGLVLSGKPTNKFVYEGFLSNKKSKRRKQLEKLKEEDRTVVLYESPHRVIKFLEDFLEVVGDKEIVVARELTKKFEEIKRGTARALLAEFTDKGPKGEFTIIF